MIAINYQGRFGNNLFQYFFGRILAERFGVPIANHFNSIILPSNDKDRQWETREMTEVNDGNFLEFLQYKVIYSNLLLYGFFQNRKIVELLEENRNMFVVPSQNKGTFVHVRLGDIQNSGRDCGVSYYEKALFGCESGFISSDSPDHPLVKYLMEKFNLELYQNTPEKTILFGSSFDTKVLSLGTFSWWIGFLGNQSNIICPNVKEYREWHGDIFPLVGWKEISK